MENKVYTIIAYKPSSEDYCRGCHMASYSSSFDHIATESRKDAFDFLVARERENQKHESAEADYDYTVFINGREPYDLRTWDEESETLGTEVEDDVALLLREARAEAKRLKDEEDVAKATAEAKHKEKQRVAALKAAEQRDQQEYERLKAKYSQDVAQ